MSDEIRNENRDAGGRNERSNNMLEKMIDIIINAAGSVLGTIALAIMGGSIINGKFLLVHSSTIILLTCLCLLILMIFIAVRSRRPRNRFGAIALAVVVPMLGVALNQNLVLGRCRIDDVKIFVSDRFAEAIYTLRDGNFVIDAAPGTRLRVSAKPMNNMEVDDSLAVTCSWQLSTIGDSLVSDADRKDGDCDLEVTTGIDDEPDQLGVDLMVNGCGSVWGRTIEIQKSQP